LAKNRVSRKFQKIQNKFFLEKRGRGTPGVTQGPPQASTPLVGVASPQVAPSWGVAHLGPSKVPPPSHLLSLSRKTPENFLKPEFLLFLLVNFDLLAQPIFAADFWRDCTLVCISSLVQLDL